MQEMQETRGPRPGDESSDGGVTGAVQQTAHQVQEKAGELRSQASSRVRQEVESRSTQVGEQSKVAGETLRQAGNSLREEGNESLAGLFDSLAGRVDNVGRYFADTDGDRLLRDVEQLARRKPWAAGGIAAVAGFLASRILKASSSRRYSAGFEGRTDASQATSPAWTAPAPPPPAVPPPTVERGPAVGTPLGGAGA
jgi:hypothetical protein